MSNHHHIAQINVARMVAPLGDSRMAGFASRIDEINALAEASPGFVWRLKSETGDATSIQAFADPTILVNMSVWESIDALHDYVYRTTHRELVRERKNWFLPYDGPYYALFWIPSGHVPTVDEGKERLAYLAENGASPRAFWFGKRFSPSERETHSSVDPSKSSAR
jgi:hypothetical protein